MEQIFEESMSPEERMAKAKEMYKKKLERLRYINQRIKAAKSANNKRRLAIAMLDKEICQLDMEKYKKKMEKYKIKMS